MSLALYFFAGVSAAAALGVLLFRQVLYAALSLLACLLSLAALYIIRQAEYVAITQIIVYAGGILVIILFGIMITSRLAGKPLQVQTQYPVMGGILALLIFFVLMASQPSANPGNGDFIAGHWQRAGRLLMTEYALAFETAGVLLLVCLIGAAITTIQQRKP
jgi:NADH:ubiquinone oxidoreductase subunit 6 (subunit J)